MTPLNYVSIVTGLLTIAMMLQLIARPSFVDWPPRTVRIAGAAVAIVAILNIVVILIQQN